jgi:hypothetical protein
LKAYALIWRPPYARSDDLPLCPALYAGPDAQPFAIEKLAEARVLNAGDFGVLPVEIEDDQYEHSTGDSVYLTFTNRDNVWWFHSARFETLAAERVREVRHTVTVALTLVADQ